MPAELGGAERAPGDAVARIIKTGKRTLEPADAGETISFGHTHVVHDDLAGGRRAQAELAFDLDRKSTRLNSSHMSISYAVFCLKKKNTKQQMTNHHSTHA